MIIENYLSQLGRSICFAFSAVALAGVSLLASPAVAAPTCVPGFASAASTDWLLQCTKTVPIAQKGVALTEAHNATCTTDRYWNFGPKVEAVTHRARGTVTVSYTCGHVEG